MASELFHTSGLHIACSLEEGILLDAYAALIVVPREPKVIKNSD